MDQRVLWFYTPVALLAPYGATRKHPMDEIDEARPLSGFCPTHADFVTEMHF